MGALFAIPVTVILAILLEEFRVTFITPKNEIPE